MSFTISNVNASFPCGTIISFVGTSDPNGWLICDGRLLTTLVGTQYDNLKTLLSGTNLPDLRGKNLYGHSTIKTTGGQDSLSIAYDNLPNHQHIASAAGGEAHTHNYTDNYYQDENRTDDGESNQDDDGGRNVSHNKTTETSIYNNHTLGAASFYGSATTVTAINITNPYYTVNWIIKY